VGRFRRAAEFELRLLRRDRDHAGRGVLAEQRRLRTAQNFDALDVGEVGDLRSRARAVHVVDEHADRRLDSGIVGTVAEAADEEIGVRRALALTHAERGNDGLQVAQIADLAAFDRLGGGDRYGYRGVLQRLLTLGGGDED